MAHFQVLSRDDQGVRQVRGPGGYVYSVGEDSWQEAQTMPDNQQNSDAVLDAGDLSALRSVLHVNALNLRSNRTLSFAEDARLVSELGAAQERDRQKGYQVRAAQQAIDQENLRHEQEMLRLNDNLAVAERNQSQSEAAPIQQELDQVRAARPALSQAESSLAGDYPSNELVVAIGAITEQRARERAQNGGNNRAQGLGFPFPPPPDPMALARGLGIVR